MRLLGSGCTEFGNLPPLDSTLDKPSWASWISSLFHRQQPPNCVNFCFIFLVLHEVLRDVVASQGQVHFTFTLPYISYRPYWRRDTVSLILKWPVLLIDKYKNPHCFKEVDKKQLPIWYQTQINSWMNKVIFESWFRTEFVPRVNIFLQSKNLPQAAVLLVDKWKSYKFLKVDGPKIAFSPFKIYLLM